MSCSTFGVDVTPDGTTLAPKQINTSGFAVFTVENTGNTVDTYNLTCGGSSGVTCTSTPAPVTVSAFSSVTVKLFYTVGSVLQTGRLNLLAESPTSFVENSGFVLIPIVAPPGPPIVTLVNPNGLNADRSQCLTTSAGQAGAWQCGDVQIAHALPGYSTMGRERSLTLLYNSGTASPRPRVAVWVTEGASSGSPTTVVGSLYINGALRDSATYAGWGGPAAEARQLVLSYDASADTSGLYDYRVIVENHFTSALTADTVTGQLLVANRSKSLFGAGWWLAGLEQLYLAQPGGGIAWVGGDGSVKLYSQQSGSTTKWIAPPGAFRDTILFTGTQYRRFARHADTVVFDNAGRHIGTWRHGDQRTTFGYTSGKLTSITVPPTGAGTVYTLAYDGAGKLDSLADPGKRGLNVTVASGRITAIRDPDLNSVTFTYTSTYGSNLITTRRSRRGYDDSLFYGPAALLTRIKTPLDGSSVTNGFATTLITPWNSGGASFPHSTPIAAGDTSQFFTEIDGPRSVADISTIWVNAQGAPTRITDPLGFTTLIKRTNAGFPFLVTRVDHPDNTVDSLTYNTRGNLIQARDSTNAFDSRPTAVTSYAFSANMDSPSSVTDPEGLVTGYKYNQWKMTDSVIAPNGHVTEFEFVGGSGAFRSLLKGVVEHNVMVWDQTVPGLVGPNDLRTTFKIDGLGNVDTVVTPLGRTTAYARNSFQQVTDTHDPAGHHLEFVYDKLNRRLKTLEHLEEVSGSGFTTPLESRVHYAIDVMDSVIDPRGVARRYSYDAGGRQIVEQDDYVNVEVRWYNQVGQVDSVRQRVFQSVTGRNIRNQYDANGRLTKKAWPTRDSLPADSVLYTYDAMGRMLTAKTSGYKTTRTYFGTGAIKKETQSLANGTALAFTHSYTYDKAGRRLTYTFGTPGNSAESDLVSYRYAANGDLKTIVVKWRGDATARDSVMFFWDGLGRRDSLKYSNGGLVRFAYDADGAVRLVCGTDGRTGNTDPMQFSWNNKQVDAEGQVLQALAAIPGPNLRCGANTKMPPSQTNTYDGRHQLATMQQGTDPKHTYTYDASGNLIKDDNVISGGTDYDYVSLTGHNRLDHKAPSLGTTVYYRYDLNGARQYECQSAFTCAPDFSDPNTTVYRRYYYDGLAQLRGTDEFIVPGQQVNYPEYDPLGRLVNATDGPQRFGYDAENIVSTYSDTSQFGWTFVQGPGLDDPILGRWYDNTQGVAGELRGYFITDGAGRMFGVGGVTGADVTVTNKYQFQGGRYAGGTQNATTFASDRNSSATMKELSFFRNRYYDQQTGRWTQEDPIGVAGGLNLYQFNGNNPVAYTDPFGLCDPKKDATCLLINAVGGLLAPAQGPLELIGTAAMLPLGGSMGMMEPVAGGLGLGAPLALRARQIASTVGAVTRDKTTIAVARVMEADGSLSTLVGSSEKVLRPAQRAALEAGEEAVAGVGHAEATVVRAAQQNGQTVLGVGASRPICPSCADLLRGIGARLSSVLKE